MDKEKLLKELMNYDFVVYELVLYLDTHPHDAKALEMYKSVSEKARELKEEFESRYGALSSDVVKNLQHWTWINSPWPWENQED